MGGWRKRIHEVKTCCRHVLKHHPPSDALHLSPSYPLPLATASPNLPSCLPQSVSERREISLSFGLSVLGCILGLRACGQSAGDRKRVCHSLLCCHDFPSRRGNNFFAVFSCERRKERDILAGFILSCKRKRENPCLLYPFLQEKERESMLALSFPARERERELLSMPALSSLCKGGGSVFFFLLCFFLSFSRLAFELFGIFDLAS